MSYLKLALIALVASVLPPALPATASADQPACPAGTSALLESFSPRTLVPVGVRTARVFWLHGGDSSTNSNLALSAPPDYSPVSFEPKRPAGNKDVLLGLNVTAPRPGPFEVQGSWTYSLGAGGPCTATGTTTLTAVNPTPLKLKAPKRRVDSSARKPEYNKLEWTWKCTDATVAPPLEATLRYQLKKRGKLSNKAKTQTIVAQDPCDDDQAASFVKKTPSGVNLVFSAGGGASGGLGAVSLTTAGRYKGRPVIHLGVVIKQGSTRLVSRAYCSAGAGYFFHETRNCKLPF